MNFFSSFVLEIGIGGYFLSLLPFSLTYLLMESQFLTWGWWSRVLFTRHLVCTISLAPANVENDTQHPHFILPLFAPSAKSEDSIHMSFIPEFLPCMDKFFLTDSWAQLDIFSFTTMAVIAALACLWPHPICFTFRVCVYSQVHQLFWECPHSYMVGLIH